MAFVKLFMNVLAVFQKLIAHEGEADITTGGIFISSNFPTCVTRMYVVSPSSSLSNSYSSSPIHNWKSGTKGDSRGFGIPISINHRPTPSVSVLKSVIHLQSSPY